jgi:hypothetical protein
VTLRARFPDGTEITRIIYLDDDREAEMLAGDSSTRSTSGSLEARFGHEDQTGWGSLDPATGGSASLGTEVSIEAPPGAVSSKTRVGITRKGPEILPALEPGMVNVTAPPHAAYRFVPKGQQFAKPVRIKLPYDPSLLPEGMAPEEIQTFYFDDGLQRWQALPRKSVVRASRQIISETSHFTLMINAVLVLPDHPGPVSFNPTSIKDLKAADPSSGIDLIEPPEGNNEGTARVAFPIRLPKARGAFQPSLAISYDSSGGNGWLGVGWNLAGSGSSRISLDTRFGVPEYTGEERYLLDGEALVPVDVGGLRCLDGAIARQYHPRVERSFRRILRCGERPSRFWFEVTDKSGMLFVYGRAENARLTSYLPMVTTSPLDGPEYAIAEWHLERVVDANGNLTQLTYQHDSKDTGAPGEPFRQVYLRAIQYTGSSLAAASSGKRDFAVLEGGQSGPYLVELRHVGGERPDTQISGRQGFKTALRRLLGTIEVHLVAGPSAGLIRKYLLEYETGDLAKKRLERIEVQGANEAPFYAHRFQYEEHAPDAAGVTLFGAPVPWVTEAPSDRGLSGSREWSFGLHAFGGLGFGFARGAGTVGLGFGYSHRRAHTELAFVDLNGDNLPDRVHQGSSPVLFNQGVGASLSSAPPTWDPGYGNSSVTFGQRLGDESGNSFNVSLQGFVSVIAAEFGANYALSSSESFLADANGDGLVDLVKDGQVIFNLPRTSTCDGSSSCCPGSGFCFNQSFTPEPSISFEMSALQNFGAAQALVEGTPSLARANQQMARAFTPEDALIEWTAPYYGSVDISGTLQLAQPVAPKERRDGVRLAVYHYDPLYHPGTAPDEVASYVKVPGDDTPTAVWLSNQHVDAGTIFYFVVSTLSDFPMRDETGALKPIEKVKFNPVITYRNIADVFRDLPGPTGALSVEAERDFVVAGEPQGSVTTGFRALSRSR